MSDENGKHLSQLQGALSEARATVRSYDTKAQICAIGYVFSLNIVLQINQQVWPAESVVNLGFVLTAWGLLLVPMVLFATVIYPSRKSTADLHGSDTDTPKQTLYPDIKTYRTTDALKAAVRQSDPFDEVAFELMRTARIREIKRTRFTRALIFAGFSFATMFLLHVVAVTLL